MSQRDAISEVKLNASARTGAVDFREEYNKMLANISVPKKKMPPIFGDGFAATNSVNKASTDFNG